MACLLGLALIPIHVLAAAPTGGISPYPPVHGGSRAAGAKVAASPDPMVDYRWEL